MCNFINRVKEANGRPSVTQKEQKEAWEQEKKKKTEQAHFSFEIACFKSQISIIWLFTSKLFSVNGQVELGKTTIANTQQLIRQADDATRARAEDFSRFLFPSLSFRS